MKNDTAANSWGRTIQRVLPLLLSAALSMSCVSAAAAQKEKKSKRDKAASDSVGMLVPMSDEQQIDYLLSEMLGAWQLGDIEKLHKDYAEDVSVVNGGWAPPIVGWTNYLAIYQQQRAHMEKVRMDRSNTYIKVSGAAAWTCYQWDFQAIVDGQPAAARGQTTLVLEKHDNRWVIVHNHTSLVQNLQPAVPANTPPAQPPAKPAPR